MEICQSIIGQTHTQGQFSISSLSEVDTLGLWEETGVPGETHADRWTLSRQTLRL